MRRNRSRPRSKVPAWQADPRLASLTAGRVDRPRGGAGRAAANPMGHRAARSGSTPRRGDMQAASQDIILSAKGLSKEFSGFIAVKRRRPRGPARLDPRADRAERRRQDHLLQPPDQVPAADRAAASSTTAATSPPWQPADIARLGLVRSFQISAVFPHLTALENVRIALQRQRGDSFDFWRSETVLGDLDGDALGAARRGRPDRLRPHAGGRAPLRPQAGAGDRHHAGARPGDAAARRADGRHGAGGRRAHHRADPPGVAEPHHPDGRAQSVGGRVALGPHHRAGARPDAGRGRLRHRVEGSRA